MLLSMGCEKLDMTEQQQMKQVFFWQDDIQRPVWQGSLIYRDNMLIIFLEFFFKCKIFLTLKPLVLKWSKQEISRVTAMESAEEERFKSGINRIWWWDKSETLSMTSESLLQTSEWMSLKQTIFIEIKFRVLYILSGSQGKEQKNDQTYMTGRKMGTGRMSNLKPNFSKAYYRYIMISTQLIKARITKAPCKFLQLCTKIGVRW